MRKLYLLLLISMVAALPTFAAMQQDISPQNLLSRGENQYNNIEFQACIETMSSLIDMLLSKSSTSAMSMNESLVLTQAYELRALSLFNINAEEKAKEDFARLLKIDPAYDLKEQYSFPVIEDIYSTVKKANIGFLSVSVTPAEAELFLDNKKQTLAELTDRALFIGEYTLMADFRGYASNTQTIEIEANQTAIITIELERTTATLSLRTSPADVEVYLDGKMIGKTSGTADENLIDVAAQLKIPLTSISEEFFIDQLELGIHRIELRKDCYVNMPIRIPEITAANDFVLSEPFVLKKSAGSIDLVDLPSDAEVFLNGDSMGKGTATFRDLCSGEYKIEVLTTTGRFAQTVQVERDTTSTIDVVLKPAMAFAEPVVPDLIDNFEKQRMKKELHELYSKISEFSMLSVDEEFNERLARIPAVFDRKQSPKTEWISTEQLADIRRCCRKSNASVIVIPEFVEEKFGYVFRIIFVSSASSVAESTIVNISEPNSVEQFLVKMQRMVDHHQPWMGFKAIDTRIYDGPVVLSVQESSPAAVAGILPGDVLVAFDGEQVTDIRTLQQLIANTNYGEIHQLRVVSGGKETDRNLEIVKSPRLLTSDTGERLLIPALARLRIELLKETNSEMTDLYRFNMALALYKLGEYEEMIKYLRDIEMSDQPGVNQGTVNYYLGVGFELAGYRSESQRYFQRAMQYETATIDNNDGPLVLPLIRMRLQDTQ